MRQFLVDDKGAIAIVLLGLPPLYHTDDPSRGVYIALEIRQRLERIRVQKVRPSIGVTTGMTFCGAIGYAQRCDYAAGYFY